MPEDAQKTNVRGILFNEMHSAAVQITTAYASSVNADPERIPQLFKDMMKAQVDVITAGDKSSK